MEPVKIWMVIGGYTRDDGKSDYHMACLTKETAIHEAETYISEAIESENKITWDFASDIYFTGEVELFDGLFTFECSYLELSE